jgi:signal transduction histidine kinase
MRSIRRHLLVWVLGALSLGSLVLVLVSYLVTLEEMDEIFADNLKQVALAIEYHRDAEEFGGLAGRSALPNAYERPGEDFDFVTVSWSADGRITDTSDPNFRPPFDPTPGWRRLTINGEQWHVYTLVQPDRSVVQAAQRVVSRSELAVESASKMLVPLVLLTVLIGSLLVVALRRGLQPLDLAAQGVAARSASSLEPISQDEMPREIHPLVRAINGLMHKLSLAFATQRRFVADAAHELRSPVTALRLQLQILERAQGEAARSAAIGELRAGIARSQHLIEQLLDLSRLEPDAPRQPFMPVALGALVRSAVGNLSVKAEHKGIDLGADVQADVVVPGDVHQLMVLLNNLIENALRYTPAGGVVDVWAGWLDGLPALRVSDSGPGIPEAERERVFDRFFRGEDAQRSDAGDVSGSGLGLAIVRSAAERHGARVSLHTPAAGQGLEVRVVFARPAENDKEAGPGS